MAICVPLYFVFFQGYFQGEGPLLIKPFAIVQYAELWTRVEPVLRSLWQAGAVKGTVDWTFRAIAAVLAALVVAIYFVMSYGTRLLGMGVYVRRYGARMPADLLVVTCIVLGGLVPAYLFSMT